MTTSVAPVHLGTGEILERLDEQPPETLAEALHLAQQREAEAKRWVDALAAELRNRLKLRQTKRAVFGDWEIEAPVTRSRAWDADDLEGVLRRLVDDGVVRAGDVADVITREPVVAGKAALALRSRLTGDALSLVDQTWAWKERPGPVTVTRSIALPEPAASPPRPLERKSSLDPMELFA